jgi:hypothetical protein
MTFALVERKESCAAVKGSVFYSLLINGEYEQTFLIDASDKGEDVRGNTTKLGALRLMVELANKELLKAIDNPMAAHDRYLDSKNEWREWTPGTQADVERAMSIQDNMWQVLKEDVAVLREQLETVQNAQLNTNRDMDAMRATIRDVMTNLGHHASSQYDKMDGLRAELAALQAKFKELHNMAARADHTSGSNDAVLHRIVKQLGATKTAKKARRNVQKA